MHKQHVATHLYYLFDVNKNCRVHACYNDMMNEGEQSAYLRSIQIVATSQAIVTHSKAFQG